MRCARDRGVRSATQISRMVTTPVTAEVVAVFVDERDGGNLAGVVLDPPDLSEAQMQSIADCGHATIGSFASAMTAAYRWSSCPRGLNPGPIRARWPRLGRWIRAHP
ncbi:MAG: hypothetical protein NVSMB5_20580 [Candidatus Velthaea sp.]